MIAPTPPEPTLTNITQMGREAVKYILVGLVVLMVGRVVLSTLVSLYKALNPEPPPPPTVGFGLLPAIKFPSQKASDKPKSYKLETANGKLPYFGDRAKVFFMPQSSPSLLADQRAKEIASTYNFVFQPSILDERTYRWQRSTPLETTLEMDIQNYSFQLRTDYLTRPELIVNVLPPDERTAVAQVKSFLDRAGLLAEDVATASAMTTYLKSLGSQLEPAVSVSDADFIRVDLNRTPVDDEYFMYTPEGYKGIISAVLTGVFKDNANIVELDYHYYPADTDWPETYPLKDIKLAWQELQNGEAFVVDKGDKEEAVIRNIYLGYFDSYEEQEYLQAIYVFAGDGGFLAYVSAIDSKFIVN